MLNNGKIFQIEVFCNFARQKTTLGSKQNTGTCIVENYLYYVQLIHLKYVIMNDIPM